VRYFLDPFGCVKNQVDAETMMAHLNGSGWVSSDDPGKADLIIVNSCGFIESAKQESINAVLDWRKQYPGKKILLAGCLSQRYGAELAESLPEADVLFGNRDLSRISEAAGRVMDGRKERGGAPFEAAVPPGRDLPRANAGSASPLPAAISGERPLLSLPGSAYIKISEGCDNRCTFCAIPLIRGPLVCRSVPDIIAECRELLRRGVRELNLIGQDTGSFGRHKAGGTAAETLPLLLEQISRLEGRFWVRLLYIHPDHFPLPILDILGRDKRFLPYFDIPFQHGSAKILAAMNRRGDAETYLGLIGTIRKRLPGAVIRSTLMTGFPGETEEDFAALLDFQEQARLDWMGCFAYSREEDTPACTMKNQTPKKIALRRKALLEERQIPITEKNMDRFTGRDFDVLVEEKIEGAEELYVGRLYCQAPEVDGVTVIHGAAGSPLEPGTFIPGRVFGRRGFDLQVSPGIYYTHEP
jgi:ribosomal protein S12 methylthiotransferase